MVHLSYDLDFHLFQFMQNRKGFPNVKGCEIFIKDIFKLNVPIIIVNEHHEILPFINEYKFNTIINVDFHSDLVIEPYSVLDEGSWANFYKYRNNTNFIWRYPEYESCVALGYGRCDSMVHFDSPMPYNKMGYNQIRKYEGVPKLTKDIHSISISLSKDWCDCNAFSDIVYKYKLWPTKK